MTQFALPLLSFLVAAGSIACGGSKEDTKLCKELRAKVEAEKLVHAEHQTALKTGIIKALDSLPVAGTEACEAKDLNWQKSTTVSGESFNVDKIPQPFYLGNYRAGKTCGLINQENVKNMIAGLTRESEALRTGHRLHFFETSRVGAKLIDGKSYSPGNVRGKLLVWSYAEKKFVCAADSYAESGSKLYTVQGGIKSNQDLDDHLTDVAVRKGIEGLKAIDPNAVAPPEGAKAEGADADAGPPAAPEAAAPKAEATP